MPLTIELPSFEGQTAFNLRRWREVLADPFLAKLSHRIETDRHGHIVMSPPPAFSHGRRQAKIAGLMLKLMPDGQAVTECPLSTPEGVKAIDVAWISPVREENASEPVVLERAPEICVEIISPSNRASEIEEKRVLYFEAGAQEVWTCSVNGQLKFYLTSMQQVDASSLCPDFPKEVA
jgi:Uma2 family endonuclease